MIEGLENRQIDEGKYTWNPGDVVIHKSLEALKRDLRAQGKTFIPSRSEKTQKEG